jgi:predicted protein tyrosine phosphatase
MMERYIQAQIGPVEHPWALISIYDALPLINIREMESLKKMGCTTFVSLRFEDLTDTDITRLRISCPGETRYPFTEDYAQQIINLLDRIRDSDVQTLIIHCAAGVSRSGAVGVFASRYLGYDENKFRKQNAVCPNFWILSVLNKVAGINTDYVKFWEDDIRNDRLRSRIIFRTE